MRGAVSALALAAAVVLAPVALGQAPAPTTKIAVRAINGKTGKPLAGVELELYGRDQQLYPHEFVHPLGKAQAGADGTAVFEIRPPLPDVLSVGFSRAGVWAGCSGFPDFSTYVVVAGGIVAPDRCDPKCRVERKFSAKPGEIVLFARKFTRWDYFKQEIL
jgi:hypothetical protein